MNTAEKVRLILLEDFVKAQARNPNYSMRAYARKIGVAQSAISEILSGKRPLSKKTAHKILEGLDKSPQEIANTFEDHSAPATSTHISLDMDLFHTIADWHYHAILSLAETKGFQSSDQWIAKRLGISEKTATEAVEKLLRLEMLIRDETTGKLKTTGQQFEAISAIANPALRKANRQNLELATEALEQVPLDQRDFTAITLCMDPDKIDHARKMIKNFRRNFNRVMESGQKKDVYKLCIQLFPLTKKEGDSK